MHGQIPWNLDEKLVGTEQSYRWLKTGNIKGEMESTIVAAQDQAISTNYFKNKILKEEIAGYVNNTKKPLTIWSQDALFWRRTNT